MFLIFKIFGKMVPLYEKTQSGKLGYPLKREVDFVHFVYIPLFYLNSRPFNFYEKPQGQQSSQELNYMEIHLR